VALLSEICLEFHERFVIPNYHVFRAARFSGFKGGTAVAIRKDIPYNRVDHLHLVSTEATVICIPIGNREILLVAVYKHLHRAWSDADVINLLNLRKKSLLAGDLNAKSPVWNSQVSNLQVRNS
jgi:hypothetical protein